MDDKVIHAVLPCVKTTSFVRSVHPVPQLVGHESHEENCQTLKGLQVTSAPQQSAVFGEMIELLSVRQRYDERKFRCLDRPQSRRDD